MRHFIKLYGETKRIIDGKVVEDSMINSEYNGKKLHVDQRHNNEFKHVVIDNKDIKNLLYRKTSKINLVDRLMRDYGKKQRTVKKKLRKHIIKHTIKNRFK
jgi:hypothetical protein